MEAISLLPTDTDTDTSTNTDSDTESETDDDEDKEQPKKKQQKTTTLRMDVRPIPPPTLHRRTKLLPPHPQSPPPHQTRQPTRPQTPREYRRMDHLPKGQTRRRAAPDAP